jgi:ribosomal protein S18 acetylase RimI-like enzyme
MRVLRRIDRYLDQVPRAAADVESIGPFTLFVKRGPGWPYYARPTPGATGIGPADVRAVRSRQRALAVPEAFEWIEELTPGMGDAGRAAGLAVLGHPLMRLSLQSFRPVPAPEGFEVRVLDESDDLAMASAVARIGFGTPGVEPGSGGVEALAGAAAGIEPETIAFVRDRLARGLTVTVAAYVEGAPVSVGSHQPVDGATEVVGVATLPALRRQGLAGAVTSMLVEDALGLGLETIFLSAGDDEVARVYERLGFERIGSAGAAEPPE